MRITKADGTVNVQYLTFQEGSVLLKPDLRKYFPNSVVHDFAAREVREIREVLKLRIGQSRPVRADRFDSIRAGAS